MSKAVTNDAVISDAVASVTTTISAAPTAASCAPGTRVEDAAAGIFDARLADSITRAVPLARIIDLIDRTHAPARVAEYRDAMRRGDRFPPIAVLRAGRWYLVADGHKRLTAFRALQALHSLERDVHLLVQVWTLRRWLHDQWRQACANAAKNRRIFQCLWSNPREAARLIGSTLAHWQRVASCLASYVLRVPPRLIGSTLAHWRRVAACLASPALPLLPARQPTDSLALPGSAPTIQTPLPGTRERGRGEGSSSSS